MKTKADSIRDIVIKINKELDKYNNVVLFQEKIAKSK